MISKNPNSLSQYGVGTLKIGRQDGEAATASIASAVAQSEHLFESHLPAGVNLDDFKSDLAARNDIFRLQQRLATNINSVSPAELAETQALASNLKDWSSLAFATVGQGQENDSRTGINLVKGQSGTLDGSELKGGVGQVTLGWQQQRESLPESLQHFPSIQYQLTMGVVRDSAGTVSLTGRELKAYARADGDKATDSQFMSLDLDRGGQELRTRSADGIHEYKSSMARDWDDSLGDLKLTGLNIDKAEHSPEGARFLAHTTKYLGLPWNIADG